MSAQDVPDRRPLEWMSDLRPMAPGPRVDPPGQPLKMPEPKEPTTRKPLKKRNAPRLAARLAEAFGEQAALCRRRPCSVAGCRGWPVVPHHYPSRGAGGKDRDTSPLCVEHHDRAHAGEDLGVDFLEVAAALAAELAARPEHNCEAFAVLRENAKTLDSRYVCGRCGGTIPDEQPDGPS